MALQIRERRLTGRGVGAVGTTNNPLPVEGLVGTSEPTVQNFKLRLGFEAIPSTQVLSFVLGRPAQLRVLRRSTDPYIVHVAVGLQGPDDNRGPGRRPLVQTANGDSGWHALEAGRWWLVVACGMPIDISLEIDIQLLAIPAEPQLARAMPQPIARLLAALTLGDRLPRLAPPGREPACPPPVVRGRATVHPQASPPLSPALPPAPALPAQASGDALVLQHRSRAIDAAALKRAGLLPEDFDLWELRPWRGGVVGGFPWLQDRRGHFHAFSPWPLLITPLPCPLEADEVALTAAGLGALLLRADALANGIAQGRFRTDLPQPSGPVAYELLLQGRVPLRGTWHPASSGGGAQDQLA